MLLGSINLLVVVLKDFQKTCKEIYLVHCTCIYQPMLPAILACSWLIFSGKKCFLANLSSELYVLYWFCRLRLISSGFSRATYMVVVIGMGGQRC
jgi:hypothetical protein